MALVAGGCGGGTVDAGTTPLDDGTEVSSQIYLADTAAAADAVSDFSASLSEAAPRPRPATLWAIATRLGEARDRTALLAARLRAERLEDRRLEEQRGHASAALDSVVSAMDDLVTAAAAGEAEDASRASTRFASAVAQLRSLPALS